MDINTGVEQDSPSRAARFNEKGYLQVWGWRCPNTPETHYTEVGSSCDRTAGHANSVNTTGFLVSFFCFVVFISHQLFACLRREYVHCCCKECTSRQLCLFVCYGEQELRQTMDGGGSDGIEDRFA
jgi:hypothetical protein